MSVQSIRPANGPMNAVVRPPGSKSLSNRALVAAALADGDSVLDNLLLADDIEFLCAGLQALGVAVNLDRHRHRAVIRGCHGHLPECDAELNCGESGTMLRFCSALCAAAVGDYRLCGRGRLPQRPMAPLIGALQQLGARFAFEDREHHLPFVIYGRGLTGGEVVVDASQSSQFISALLLAAPCARNDVMIAASGTPVSEPYVHMTVAVMKAFGVFCLTHDFRRVIVPAPQRYQAVRLRLEPDASSAGYFLAAAAICGGQVRIEGLGRDSLQGDVALVDILNQMGCDTVIADTHIALRRDPQREPLHGLHLDMGRTPDLVPTAAVVGLFAEGPTRIGNVAHLRHKESDRLNALGAQLSRLGADVTIGPDGMTIEPPRRIAAALLDPARDHRLAMALALVGLRVDGVSIRNPECVHKSYPGFFLALEQAVGGPPGGQTAERPQA